MSRTAVLADALLSAPDPAVALRDLVEEMARRGVLPAPVRIARPWATTVEGLSVISTRVLQVRGPGEPYVAAYVTGGSGGWEAHVCVGVVAAEIVGVGITIAHGQEIADAALTAAGWVLL